MTAPKNPKWLLDAKGRLRLRVSLWSRDVITGTPGLGNFKRTRVRTITVYTYYAQGRFEYSATQTRTDFPHSMTPEQLRDAGLALAQAVAIKLNQGDNYDISKDSSAAFH